MDTRIVTINPEHIDTKVIEEAGRILKRGGLVAFPTETVYGLGGDALNAESSGKIYAAGLDVVTGEPLSEKTPIFDCENASVTAHIAWAPAEARYRTVRIAVDNLKNWLAGKPTSVI